MTITLYKHKRFQRKCRESFGDVIFARNLPQLSGTFCLSGSDYLSHWTTIQLCQPEAGP